MFGIIAKCPLTFAGRYASFIHFFGLLSVCYLFPLRVISIENLKNFKGCVTLNFLHRTWAEIDLAALVHNFQIIKQTAPTSKLMAVVKANAYGHSVGDIAPCLEKAGADCFAVSNIEEALQLREIGIKKPILILGYTPVNMAKALYENDITQTVYSKEYADALNENTVAGGFSIKIHIKLDTGMSRLGFDCRDDGLCGVGDAIAAAKMSGFNFEGIFTHFAVSDRSADNDDRFTDEQYARFCRAVKVFESNGLTPKILHCCNSAALIKDGDKHLNLCRPGIILYGLRPSDSAEFHKGLTPVMTLKSVVSMVKTVEKDTCVSYGKTFKTTKEMKIATVAAGYADGYPRALSNKAYVLINGKKAQILGRVCMDQLVVDITNIDGVKMGDEVILFGKDLPVDVLADLCGTINYEIVCGISPRVPRVFINGDKL